MLRSLNISNIALITKLALEFNKGLNIMSGETGAGKSIIIDSLNFVLGERADKSLIRSGSDYAEVQAVFEVEINEQIKQAFEIIDIEAENTVIIKRRMSLDNKNDCKINGKTVTLQMLKRMTSTLADILGQHEHQSLLKISSHIDLLDKFAACDKTHVQNLYKEYINYINELNKFGDAAERERRIDLLKYQIDEIEKANLSELPEQELLDLRAKMQNSERIATGVSSAINIISEDTDGAGALTALTKAITALGVSGQFDKNLTPLIERLESCRIELKDISDTMSDILEEYNFSPEYANKIEAEYDALKLLKKKYGATLEDINNYLIKCKNEYELLSDCEVLIEDLNKKIKLTHEKLTQKCDELSATRKKFASKFEDAVMAELKELGMNGTSFRVEFNKGELSGNGYDLVEFLISPNIGEPLKPLQRIVSGGEMSRLMLAIKRIVTSIDGIDLLVFDEIDTGISGNIANVVAKKLYSISAGSQVIAVTHLPQLAAIADNNYLISKSVSGGKTETHVIFITGAEKIKEVARLSGGMGLNHSAALAEELISSLRN